MLTRRVGGPKGPAGIAGFEISSRLEHDHPAIPSRKLSVDALTTCMQWQSLPRRRQESEILRNKPTAISEVVKSQNLVKNLTRKTNPTGPAWTRSGRLPGHKTAQVPVMVLPMLRMIGTFPILPVATRTPIKRIPRMARSAHGSSKLGYLAALAMLVLALLFPIGLMVFNPTLMFQRGWEQYVGTAIYLWAVVTLARELLEALAEREGF